MKITSLLLLFLRIWTSLDISFCLIQGGKNVCRNNTTGALYCCFNYEIDNGRCVECRNGFTSELGESCIPCKDKYFGYRCLQRCKCNNYQRYRCDTIYGCVDKDVTTVSVTSDNRKNYTTHGSTITSVSEDKDPMKRIDDLGNTRMYNKEIQSINAINIAIPVGVLVLYIIIVHSLCLLMYRKRRNQGNIFTRGNIYDEIGTLHYNAVLIPPITIPDIVHEPRNSLSPLENTNMNLHEDATNDDQDIDSVKTDSTVEGNDDVIGHDSEESQIHEVLNEEVTNGYEHPYTALLPSRETEHQYNECMIPVTVSTRVIESVPDIENETHVEYINLRLHV